jgi:hypothetical protein
MEPLEENPNLGSQKTLEMSTKTLGALLQSKSRAKRGRSSSVVFYKFLQSFRKRRIPEEE